MASLSLILAASTVLQGELPRLTMPAGSTWKERLEMTTLYPAPDNFSEMITYEDSVTVEKGGLKRSRLPVDSMVAGQKLPLPENPTPMILSEPSEGWPTVAPEPENPYTRRLWRATRYCPSPRMNLPAVLEDRLPAASYEALRSKGQILTTFKEVGGLTAKGKWTFDKSGRVITATIVCENAFAPGGDGTPATFTVEIRAIDAKAR